MRSLTVLLLLPSLAIAAPLPAGATRTALLPLVAEGELAVSPSLIGAALRGELRRTEGVELQPEQDTRDHLKGAAALGLSCEALVPDCAAQLAALGGAERAVTAHLHVVSGQTRLDLAVVHVAERSVLASSTTSLSTSDTVGDVRRAVEQLYAPVGETDTPMATEPDPGEPAGDPATFTARSAPTPSPIPIFMWVGGASLLSVGVGVLVVSGAAGVATTGTGSAALSPGESVTERRDAIGLAQATTVGLLVTSGVLLAVGAGLAAGGFAMPPIM